MINEDKTEESLENFILIHKKLTIQEVEFPPIL